MNNALIRRAFLKRSALLTGGAFLPGIFNNIQAAGTNQNGHLHTIDDLAFETTPPNMVARLLANENPFGPSEKAKRAIVASIEESCRYPMDVMKQLEKMICEYEGITADNLLMASGSSPLLLAAALCYRKGNWVSGTPTYDAMLKGAENIGTKVIRVPLTADYTFDLDAMEKMIDSNTALVYICNPNNPTATVVDTAKLKAFCERVSKKTIVFVDEAYIDYLDNVNEASLIGSVKKGQNIIVARTFSKLYGFAGLRIGYAVGLPDTMKELNKYAAGWLTLSSVALHAAVAAYQDKEYLQSAFNKTMESKKFLYETLTSEGYTYIPSSANFVLFPIKMDGPRFAEEMMKRGVGIRSWRFIGKEWCRVSIGKMEEMQAFAKAFKEIS
jgi:histidinol-phosphate aminotransferase